MMIQIYWKSAHWAQKNYSSINNLTISNDESFLMSNFNLNQICKIMLTQNHKVWKFNTNDLFYILRLKNVIESYATCQNI